MGRISIDFGSFFRVSFFLRERGCGDFFVGFGGLLLRKEDISDLF